MGHPSITSANNNINKKIFYLKSHSVILLTTYYRDGAQLRGHQQILPNLEKLLPQVDKKDTLHTIYSSSHDPYFGFVELRQFFTLFFSHLCRVNLESPDST